MVFDLSRHPLVLLRVGATYSGAQWDQAILELTAIIVKSPFGLLADLRGAQMPNAGQRRSFIDMYERHDRLARAHFLALGAVGDSAILRRVITALNWLRPAPHPVEVFATREAAEAWLLPFLPGGPRPRPAPAKPRPNR
jgi:hypothetical protein